MRRSELIAKSILTGVLAGLGLMGLYLVIMSLGSGSLNFAVSELIRLKYWVSALILGFAIQMGLFAYIRACHQARGVNNGTVVASSVTSTTAMVACCAHHLTDILPIVGLSVLSAALAKYQQWFLAVGIVSNLVGILLLVERIRKIKI